MVSKLATCLTSAKENGMLNRCGFLVAGVSLLPFLAIKGEIFPGSQLLQLRVLRLGLLHDGMSGSASFHSVEEVLVGDAGLDLLALGGEHPCLVQTGHRDEGVAWTLVAKVDDPLELGRGRP